MANQIEIGLPISYNIWTPDDMQRVNEINHCNHWNSGQQQTNTDYWQPSYDDTSAIQANTSYATTDNTTSFNTDTAGNIIPYLSNSNTKYILGDSTNNCQNWTSGEETDFYSNVYLNPITSTGDRIQSCDKTGQILCLQQATIGTEPTINSITTTTGTTLKAGETIIITGSNFSNDAKVWFLNTEFNIISQTDTEIKAQVPELSENLLTNSNIYVTSNNHKVIH